METTRNFYRDTTKSMLGGVCSGLAAYVNADITLVRIIAACSVLLGSLGFWVYLIFWFIAPVAKTPAQQCELRGLPATPENMARFTK